MKKQVQQVLIVEDSAPYAKLLTKQIQRASDTEISCDIASRLNEALSLLEADGYDVVLLDLNLPDSDTEETLAQLKKMNEYAPVVVLTGLEDEQIGLRAVQDGAQDYLVKQDIPEDMLLRSMRYASARRQAQEAARRTAELELVLEQERDLSEQRRQFASIVSHELNTPLSVILTAAHLLYDQNPRITPEKRKAKLDQITSTVKRLTDLMENLLFVGRTDNDQTIQLEKISLDMVAFVQRLINVIDQLPQSSPQIVLNCPQDPLLAKLDEGLMNIVVNNLLSNACKYSPVDSVVTVTLTVDETDEDKFCLSVADQGRGIPAAELDKLFQPFYRASNVQGVRGTGVGLATVKRVVDAHGGTVHIDSTVNVGTTFTLTLPIDG